MSQYFRGQICRLIYNKFLSSTALQFFFLVFFYVVFESSSLVSTVCASLAATVSSQAELTLLPVSSNEKLSGESSHRTNFREVFSFRGLLLILFNLALSLLFKRIFYVDSRFLASNVVFLIYSYNTVSALKIYD